MEFPFPEISKKVIPDYQIILGISGNISNFFLVGEG